MAQQTIIAPIYPHMPPNTGDGPDYGDTWYAAVNKINSNFNDVYGAGTQEGSTTVNFGAFPGNIDTTATVTGQTGILATSVIDVFVTATATADHSIDEHWVDTPLVVAGNIVPGVGFTIYAISRDGGTDYGQYTVQWMWR